MRSLLDRRRTACLAACLAASLIAVPCAIHRELHAQSATNPRFDALVTLAEARMKEHGVPGVALGILADGVVTIRGRGITNVEDPLPVDAHTVFPIASISKTFAATAMMRLVGATYSLNQAIAHRGLVETLSSVQPLTRQPDPTPYLGSYARPNNSYVVRVESGELFVQDRPNDGGTPREFPVAFYGPDRVVVTDGPDRGQSIEFVRDDSGRVNWIRVVGRVAVRTP
jgi:Beta-lactamase